MLPRGRRESWLFYKRGREGMYFCSFIQSPPPQLLYHRGRSKIEMGTLLLDELMTSNTLRIGQATRTGEDFTPRFESIVCRRERPTMFARLDDDSCGT